MKKDFYLEVLKKTMKAKTRSGLEVTIFTTQARGRYPIVGAIHSEESDDPQCWAPNGRFYGDDEDSQLDLITTPQKYKQTFWVNAYPGDRWDICLHRDKKRADNFANKGRIACKEITIEFEEGQGLEDEQQS